MIYVPWLLLPWAIIMAAGVYCFYEHRKLKVAEDEARRAERIRQMSMAFAQLNARLAADRKRDDAVAILRAASGKPGESNPARMRRDALRRTHPDHGGNSEAFRKVKAALEVLGL